MGKGRALGPASALGQQHGQGDEEQQSAYAGGEGPVSVTGVAAEGEGEEGSCAAAVLARATACDAGMSPRITTYVSSSHGFTLPVDS
jgi:hypothetical protein